MVEVDGPGREDEFDPWDLDDVLQRVVVPMVHGLIRPADLERVDVGWGPREPVWVVRPSGPPMDLSVRDGVFFSTFVVHGSAAQPIQLQGENELWLLIRAAGQTWHSQIWQIEAAEQLGTLGEVAWQAADRIEDWVCEDIYWGEQPRARITIPARPSQRDD